MRLVAGLGNPGKTYEESRHNLGFWVVDRMAQQMGYTGWRTQHDSLVARCNPGDSPALLVKPQTYMNHSGRAIASLLNYYRIPLESCLIVVDDLDLEPGKLRLRENGSDGGHRGLRSIIELVGSREFKRIRIGIGRPADKRQVVSFVLGSSPEETAVLEQAVDEAARLGRIFLETGKFENWSSP